MRRRVRREEEPRRAPDLRQEPSRPLSVRGPRREPGRSTPPRSRPPWLPEQQRPLEREVAHPKRPPPELVASVRPRLRPTRPRPEEAQKEQRGPVPEQSTQQASAPSTRASLLLWALPIEASPAFPTQPLPRPSTPPQGPAGSRSELRPTPSVRRPASVRAAKGEGSTSAVWAPARRVVASPWHQENHARPPFRRARGPVPTRPRRAAWQEPCSTEGQERPGAEPERSTQEAPAPHLERPRLRHRERRASGWTRSTRRWQTRSARPRRSPLRLARRWPSPASATPEQIPARGSRLRRAVQRPAR